MVSLCILSILLVNNLLFNSLVNWVWRFKVEVWIRGEKLRIKLKLLFEFRRNLAYCFLMSSLLSKCLQFFALWTFRYKRRRSYEDIRFWTFFQRAKILLSWRLRKRRQWRFYYMFWSTFINKQSFRFCLTLGVERNFLLGCKSFTIFFELRLIFHICHKLGRRPSTSILRVLFSSTQLISKISFWAHLQLILTNWKLLFEFLNFLLVFFIFFFENLYFLFAWINLSVFMQKLSHKHLQLRV